MKTVFTPHPLGFKSWRGLSPWIACTALALAACASGPPAPTAQLAVSTAAVDQAASAGAAELAPAELSAARAKLAQARAALDAHDNTLALMLAEQTQADAQLAVTRTRTAKAEKAAAAMQEGRRVLRDEIRRNER